MSQIHGMVYSLSLLLVLIQIYGQILKRPLFVLFFSAATAIAGFYYFRGFVGDVSVTTIFILLLEALKLFRAPFFSSKEYHWRRGAVGIVLAGLLLYSSALFVMPWHAYGWGHPGSLHGWALSLIILVLGSFWWRRKSWLAALMPLVLMAYQLRLLESDNLWDYFMDPLLFLWAVAVIFTRRERHN